MFVNKLVIQCQVFLYFGLAAHFFIEIGFLWLIVSLLFFLFLLCNGADRDSTNFVRNVRVFMGPTSALPAQQMSLIRALLHMFGLLQV